MFYQGNGVFLHRLSSGKELLLDEDEFKELIDDRVKEQVDQYNDCLIKITSNSQDIISNINSLIDSLKKEDDMEYFVNEVEYIKDSLTDIITDIHEFNDEIQ